MTNQPPLIIGQKIIWHGGSSALGCNVTIKQGIYHGKVCWVGKIKEVGSFWIAGIEMEEAVKGGGDGAWQSRHIFTSKAGHGLFLPAAKVVRKSELKSSKSGKVLASPAPTPEHCKKESNLPTNEGTYQATQQNGPVNVKLSSAKGGTNLSKDSQVLSSKTNATVNQRTDNEKLSSSPQKDGKANSFKRSVFNSLSRKEKETPFPLPQDLPTHAEDQPKARRGGLLSIFKWFSRKQTTKLKKGSAERLSGRGPGSTTSLVSDSSSITFFPIRHSVSADNSSAMMRAFNKEASQIGSSVPQAQNDEEGPCRRNSLVSLHSSSSVSSFNTRVKKRMAPQPPLANRLKTSSSACELNLGDSSGKIQFQKSQNEGPLYGKIKRKAPLPPTNKDKTQASGKSSTPVSPVPADNSGRPISTFSSFSSVSVSGSSTLKSSTCSENDSLTLRSDSSQKTTPSFPLCSDSKGPLSPRPWYKRKKNKSKDKANKATRKGKDAYELWMPDIQYARQNVNAEPHKLSEAGNIEAFYDRGPQSGQRFSILSSISDLDRAATEQLERERERWKASKMEFDRSFYNVSSPHMLSQEDLINRADSLQETEAVVKEKSVMTYDNLRYNDGETSITPTSYSKQSTLKLADKKQPKSQGSLSPSVPEISLFDDPLLTSEIYNLSDSSGKVNYEAYIEEIRKELEEESLRSPEILSSKSTPMQKAIFDPELFYQLAKDAKVNCESKFSNSPKQRKETNPTKKTKDGSGSGVGVGVGTIPFDWTPPSYTPRTSQKNFGLRMNNFYTPDVSTILEGSESVTSSTTTPAEDVVEDAFNRSVLSLDQTNDLMSINSEYRMNPSDFQEITESFSADSNRSCGGNGERMRYGAGDVKTKADQIREEVLFLRERENFLMWQKAMQETELTREDDAVAIQERKKKWVCNTCTLINQPWRLHCEACSSLRPPNPRRVDSDVLPSNSAEVAVSYRTASTDSPMTVIHDDRNIADTNNESNFSERGAIQCSEFGHNEIEGTLNTNWERELQSYFTSFDDHANAMKHVESSARNPQSCGENREYIEDSNVYGKINVSNNKHNFSENKGAKPKERTPNLDDRGNNMDLQKVRRARIRRFQLNYSGSQEQQNFSSNPMPYSNGSQDRTAGIGSGVREKINQLSELSSKESKARSSSPEAKVYPSSMSESFNFFQNSEERKSFKSEPKKSPVLKQSGAVKSVISIFNQLDQLRTVQEQPSPVKVNRRSVTNILNLSQFERLISGFGSDSNENSMPAPRNNSPVMADVDIASAISKFDEMAAMAEIDCLRKPIFKVQKKRFKAEVVLNSKKNAHDTISASDSAVVQHGFIDCSKDTLSTNTLSQLNLEMSKPIQLRNCVNNKRGENRDSCDSIIKDGILYTLGESRRSMSIGSGTFELITAKDFASIEAHHSRRPSPADEPDFPSVLELSHPLLMPEIDLPDSLEVAPNKRLMLEMNSTPEEKLIDSSKNAVERLSRQLTEADGIATFKAMLEDDEQELGETNTKTISRLLRRLEDAISSGRHAEASQLANDLAKMRLSCPVTKKPTSKTDLKSSSSVNSNSPTQLLTRGTNHVGDGIQLTLEEDKEISMPVHREMSQPGPSEANANERQGGGVVRRGMKVDPLRREVKSDTTNQNLMNGLPPLEDNKPFNVKMYVEDKSSHQGPIPLLLQSFMNVGDLKLKVSEEFGFPVEVQRWILGRLLADDDSKTLATHKVTVEGCPIFLYLVAPEITENKPTSPMLSKSSGVKSDSRSDHEAIGRSKGHEIALGVNPEDKHYQEGNKNIVKSKQHLKKTKRGIASDVGRKSKINKSVADGQKLSHESKNDLDGALRYSSKDQEHKSPVEKSIFEGTLIQVNGGSKTSQTTSHPQKYKVDERILESRLPSQPRKGKNPNMDFVSLSQGSGVPPQTLHKIDGWVCPQCTLINPKERPGCEACATERPEISASSLKKNLRQAMSALEEQGCVPNPEPFECMVCFLDFGGEEGVVLRDCLHVFCRDCLKNTVKYSETAQVKCPFSNKNYSCQFSLQEREIKDLLIEEDYKRHLDKSVKEAAGSMRNVFYCKTPDCKGFCQYEDNVNVFCCDVCRKTNCLTCQAQHEGITCKQYQDDLAYKQDEEALKTKKFFDDIIRRGDGILCPQCSVMLVRKWGCDWMRCPMCRTEICWVTRGPRWGPEGQGDTSGGCKCGVNGRKCHPKCTYCH